MDEARGLGSGRGGGGWEKTGGEAGRVEAAVASGITAARVAAWATGVMGVDRLAKVGPGGGDEAARGVGTAVEVEASSGGEADSGRDEAARDGDGGGVRAEANG